MPRGVHSLGGVITRHPHQWETWTGLSLENCDTAGPYSPAGRVCQTHVPMLGRDALSEDFFLSSPITIKRILPNLDCGTSTIQPNTSHDVAGRWSIDNAMLGRVRLRSEVWEEHKCACVCACGC